MSDEPDADVLLGLLEAAPAVVMHLDEDLVIRWVNRAATQLFGYSRAEIVGTSVLDHLDVTWNPEALESVATALGSRGLRQPMTFRAFTRDGTATIVEVTANVQLHDPVLRGVVAYARPWTERWLLDQCLDAMAAGRPVEVSLRLLVEVLGSDTLEAAGSPGAAGGGAVGSGSAADGDGEGQGD